MQRQFQGNTIQYIVDDSTCIRLLYLAQNVFDLRTAENIVTATRYDVKTNFQNTGESLWKTVFKHKSQHALHNEVQLQWMYWEFSICYGVILKSISQCLNWPKLCGHCESNKQVG